MVGRWTTTITLVPRVLCPVLPFKKKMAAFRRAYNIIQQTIEMLDNSEITSFEIDGISLRIDYLTRTLVNLDSNCTPTYEIVHLLGETSRHLREVDSQSTVCAIQYAPRIYSGECGHPTVEIKEEQLSFLIDQGFQVPVIAQLFRVSTRTIERRMTKYGLSISGRLSTTLYLNCYSNSVHKGALNVSSL